MKLIPIILCLIAAPGMASRHPDRMIRSDLALNASFNRGDATDRSMYTHAPTLVGNATIAAGTRFLALDGTGDYLSYPDATALDMTGDMTIAVWVKRNGNPSAIETISAKYAAAAGWLIFIDTAGKANFDGRTSGGAYAIGPETSGSICNNAWRHVCAVRSGANWILYLDGVSAGSVSNGSHTFANSQPLSFGAYDAGSGFVSPLNGSIDDGRLYNRAISSAEVAALFSSGME